MRYLTFALAGLIVCASWPSALQAASSNKPSCKKIRDAVWAGKTLDQIIVEFDTDAETVMKCTQKKGKRKAAPKAQKKSMKSSAKSGKSQSSAGTSTEKAKSQSPSAGKPAAPRSSGRSPYQP
jgi:hypothetical protein